MPTSFSRQLGAEAGVQLNPLRDNSETPTGTRSDQVFAIAMRATRGRIDVPFKVNSSNVLTRLGGGEQMRVSALNEAWVHVVEALNSGAYEAVVQRLTVAGAPVIRWAVLAVTAVTFVNTYTTSAATPVAPFLFAVRHLECFNDGIIVEFHADETRTGGVAVANAVITLRIRDRNRALLYDFKGSLDPTAKDDFGNSLYLPDVVQARTDLVEVLIGTVGAGAVIAPTSLAYGYSAGGLEQWATSAVLSCFDEGGTAYATEDYSGARVSLQNTAHGYGYISSGGTQSAGLLAQLAQLAFATNRQLRFDIPGNLTADEAITFVEQLSFGANETAHLLHAFWSPLLTNDPTGVNPKSQIGTATLNIAYSCARNANTNAKGFARKNYPVAGREWPVRRANVTQVYNPSPQELNSLALAKINPVLYDIFTGGGRYVYRDSVTSALVDSSLRKLIAVADMSTSLDEAVTRAGKDMLQLPMQVGVKRMKDFLEELFSGAQASGWLVPSNDPSMGGAAYKFSVAPNEARPYELMDVQYWLRYDGTTRQIFVSQSLSR